MEVARTPGKPSAETPGRDAERPYSTEGRVCWFHLPSESHEMGEDGEVRESKRPQALSSIGLQSSPSPFPVTNSTSSSVGVSRFAFISPVEPLARFSKSLNRVYIPVDSGEEVEVNEHGLQPLNGAGSDFALMGSPGSSLLGTGAFGSVYKALHFPTMRRVAIKKIPKDFGRSFEFVNSFARELRSLYVNLRELGEESAGSGSGLSQRGGRPAGSGCGPSAHCPYLVTLYDAYIERYPISLCLVLEFMEGGSCEKLIQQGGCRDESMLRSIAYNALQGLNHLHVHGRLHQDIKPANILLTRAGFAKLADFGLSPILGSNDPILKVEGAGTARYWPPEIWGPDKKPDPSGRGDIWSLGLTLLAIVNGKEPLADCTARTQVEIELHGIWEEAVARKVAICEVARKRGIIDTTQLREGVVSSACLNFIESSLVEVSGRDNASQLLGHEFFKDKIDPKNSRYAELGAAVAALKTHIAIHKEWKVTPRVVDCLAKEMRVQSAELRDFLSQQLDVSIHEFDDTASKEDPSQQVDAEVLLESYEELDRLKNRVEELESKLEQQGQELRAAKAEIERLKQS